MNAAVKFKVRCDQFQHMWTEVRPPPAVRHRGTSVLQPLENYRQNTELLLLLTSRIQSSSRDLSSYFLKSIFNGTKIEYNLRVGRTHGKLSLAHSFLKRVVSPGGALAPRLRRGDSRAGSLPLWAVELPLAFGDQKRARGMRSAQEPGAAVMHL